MKPMSIAEIRERYLRFFEARGHKRLPSDSLVPANDPTLLFTGAGMNQFKDMFLGKGGLPFKRVTTSQKCLRVPDLENVGLTPRHHTFFEMLGNFSFGDYFKKECIPWEWEFFTKELGIPARNLVVTVYQDDDEAYEVWRREVGLEPERIFRFGAKENFWPADAPTKGPNGPCGPCSEIYFDNAPGEPYPDRKGLSELPDQRFTEIGNCVFTQFDRQPDGTLRPLPQKNIDVGLGLERIAAVLAGAANNFETDAFRPLLHAVARRAGKTYGDDRNVDVRMRRIADHIRALTFCIADGAMPSNEGRGYVVRKILRRAVRDGYDLGIAGAFLFELVDVVGELMGAVYPEVREHSGQCRSLIKTEEESFAGVYRQGLERLNAFLAKSGHSAAAARGALRSLPGSGEFGFQLHDTYGFPVDITRQILADHGFALDEAAFEAAMDEQRRRARAHMATQAQVFADNAAMALRSAGIAPTAFTGYDTLTEKDRALALVAADYQLLPSLGQGQEGLLVVGRSPFYAQSGGQVGDRGTVRTPTGTATVVTTTVLDGFYLHRLRVESGAIERGQVCELVVDEAARRATESNHTATHLLHAALKVVLGPHVNQAGSEVAPERLRFDYTHGERLSPEQVDRIEELVNGAIMAATTVQAVVRPLEEARAEGFMALFGEKYGDQVRTLAIGDFSKELCGGTHVSNSGRIGSFRITTETAISAGTRRIEAVTGQHAARLAREERRALAEVARALKIQVSEVPARVQQLLDESKKLRKDLEKALAADLDAVQRELEAALVISDGVKCVVMERKGLQMKELQDLLIRARKAFAPFVGVVLTPSAAEVLIAAAVSPDLTARVQAGSLVQAAATAMGGGGGGRPDLAQGKGKDPGLVAAAADAIRRVLAEAGLVVPASA